MKQKLKSNCLLLRKQPYGETSLLLQVLSEQYGYISILGKGLRQNKQQSATLLNTLNEYELIFSQPSPAGIHILMELSTISEYPADLPLQTWMLAQAGAELLAKLLIPVDEIPQFYLILKQYLDYLKSVSYNPIAIFWRFVYKLISLLGIPIDLCKCTICHQSMSLAAGYNPELGQLLCPNCIPKTGTAYLLSPESAHLLHILPVIGNYLDDLNISADNIKQLNHFFLHYLSTHFQQNIRLKSLEVFASG